MELHFPTTAQAVGQLLNVPVVGDLERKVERFSSLDGATAGALCFLSDRSFSKHLAKVEGAVVLTKQECADPNLPLTFLIVDDPKLAFIRLTKAASIAPFEEGIASSAHLGKGVTLGEGVSVGPFAVLEEGVSIGAGTQIGAHVYIGKGTLVGQSCSLYPHVTILNNVRIGNHVKIFPSAVIGSDGFGFVEGSLEEIPQIGTVVIEDHVRVGAHTTIDRATLGETRIGANTKIDNHCQIAHNCQIGKNVVLCGFVGLAGSVVLEDGVLLAGQVGVADHSRIGAGARVGAHSGVNSFLKGGGTYFGAPAIPMREYLVLFKHFKKLPELFKRVAQLEGSKNV